VVAGANRSRIALGAKLIVSVSLLLLLVARMDAALLVQVLAALPMRGVFLGLGLLATQAAVLAWRWHRVTTLIGGCLPLPTAARLTLVGLFFNQALPTSIGGDVLRVWGAYRRGLPAELALSSVLIERATGLAAIALLVASGVLLAWSDLAGSSLRWGFLLTAPLTLGAVALMAVLDTLPLHWLPAIARDQVLSVSNGMRRIGGSPVAIGELLILGVISTVVGVGGAYVVGSQIGISLGFGAYLVAVGGAVLLTVLPISVGGWGVREAAVVGTFGAMGVPVEKALVVSVLFGLGLAIVALPGGVLWLSEPSKHKAESAAWRSWRSG
jgi:hypothetical protein